MLNLCERVIYAVTGELAELSTGASGPEAASRAAAVIEAVPVETYLAAA